MSIDRLEFLRRATAAAAVATFPTADAPVTRLARMLDGDVVVPGSGRYASARLLWDTRFDALKPRAVAYCANVADVERVVRWSRSTGIQVVPRAGGHSYGGYSSGNGVVVADVSRLGGVAVSGSTATVGAGAKLIGVYAALAQHGVTVPAGSCPTVGVAGLALGGGVGYASRRFGTTADNVRQLRIVTADGELLTCDAAQHADLFWASRGGGGGNFGIATSFVFATHPVSTVSTYSIEWPWAQAAQAVAAWQAFAPHAPDALFSVIDLIATDPSVADARAHVVSAGQYFGPESDLASLLQPLTSTGTPIRVTTSTVSYLDAVLHWASCRDAASCTEPRSAFYAKSDYVNQPLSSAAIGMLVNGIAARQGEGRGALYLDAHGGSINRVPKAATAFVHRDALFSIQYTTQGAVPPGCRRCTRRCGRTFPASRIRTTSIRSYRPGRTRTTAEICRGSVRSSRSTILTGFSASHRAFGEREQEAKTMGYDTVSIDEIDPAGPGGAVRFVRRQLGALAFGINWFELPPDAKGLEHDESDTRQEEVSVVIRGDGYWLVDGERVPAGVGTFIRFDPESTRVAVAGPNGMTFISVGAPPGAYEPRGPF